MTITTTIIDYGSMGSRYFTCGKFVISGGTATGELATDLRVVEFIKIQPYHASAVLTDCWTVDETLPYKASATGIVTVTSTANDGTAYFWAIGKK